MDEWKWWPLRAALAWVVSRDNEFTQTMMDEETFNRVGVDLKIAIAVL
jgi:hypothetical protein